MDEKLARLVAEVSRSPKYAQIAPDLLARIGAAELAKGRKHKETVKAVKNKLHQVGGAYHNTPPNYPAWLKVLQEAQHSAESYQQAARQVMAHHASTHERLPLLDQFYSNIFAYLPPINSVIDVACGLNPLALPWMPLADQAAYYACDIYADMIAFVGDVLSFLPVDGQAAVCDVIESPPGHPADLGLVLKTIPCLEQIEKEAGRRLLDGLRTRYLVISFPAKSLGGRKKGMVKTYTTRFEELTAGRAWQVLAELSFETELVFVVDCLVES